MPILFFFNENVFDFSIISILIRTTIEFPEQREEIRCRINFPDLTLLFGGKISPLEMLNDKLNAQGGSTPAALAPPIAITPEQVTRHHRKAQGR